MTGYHNRKGKDTTKWRATTTEIERTLQNDGLPQQRWKGHYKMMGYQNSDGKDTTKWRATRTEMERTLQNEGRPQQRWKGHYKMVGYQNRDGKDTTKWRATTTEMERTLQKPPIGSLRWWFVLWLICYVVTYVKTVMDKWSFCKRVWRKRSCTKQGTVTWFVRWSNKVNVTSWHAYAGTDG
jgi:hypothetical protein